MNYAASVLAEIIKTVIASQNTGSEACRFHESFIDSVHLQRRRVQLVLFERASITQNPGNVINVIPVAHRRLVLLNDRSSSSSRSGTAAISRGICQGGRPPVPSGTCRPTTNPHPTRLHYLTTQIQLVSVKTSSSPAFRVTTSPLTLPPSLQTSFKRLQRSTTLRRTRVTLLRVIHRRDLHFSPTTFSPPGKVLFSSAICLSVSRITQKLINRFSQNSAEMWHIGHERNH